MSMFIQDNHKVNQIFINPYGEKKKVSSVWVNKDGIPTKVFSNTKSISDITWQNGTYKEISKLLELHYAGKIDIRDYWNVGDSREVSLHSILDGNYYIGDEIVELTIIDFCHDFSINGGKAAVTIQMKDCLTEGGQMNNTKTNTCGWFNSTMRVFCNTSFLRSLPTELQNLIKPVYKATMDYRGNKENPLLNTQPDSCFLLSETEVFGDADVCAQGSKGEGSQYRYYFKQENRKKSFNNSTSLTYNSWWLRSIYTLDELSFFHIGENCKQSGDFATNYRGVSIAMCI